MFSFSIVCDFSIVRKGKKESGIEVMDEDDSMHLGLWLFLQRPFSYRKRCVRHQKFSRYIDARRKAEERDAYLVSHDVEREALRNKISELNDRISSPESPYVAYSAHDSVRLPPPSGSAIDSSSSGIPGPSRFRNPETASRFQLVAPSPSMAEEARRLAQLRSPAQTSVSLLDPTSGNEESIFENVVVSPLPDSRPPPFYSKS